MNSQRGSADLTPHIYSKRPNKGEYRAGTESGCTVASCCCCIHTVVTSQDDQDLWSRYNRHFVGMN